MPKPWRYELTGKGTRPGRCIHSETAGVPQASQGNRGVSPAHRTAGPVTLRGMRTFPGIVAGLILPLAALPAEVVFPMDSRAPAVVRVGDEFWATASSGSWAPVFRLHQSRDLQKWEEQGAVFSVETRRDKPDWALGDFRDPHFFATSQGLRLLFSVRQREGESCIGLATATQIRGPWMSLAPLICHAGGAVDPSTVKDAEGNLWLVWRRSVPSREATFWKQKFDTDGLRLLDRPQPLFSAMGDAPGGAKLWESVTGVEFFRHGGWTYLVYTANTRFGAPCASTIHLARTQTLDGPWEAAPSALLPASAEWNCPAQPTVAEDPAGKWWIFYQAQRAEGALVGSPTLRDSMDWGEDGWPKLNGAEGAVTSRNAPPRNRAMRFSRPEDLQPFDRLQTRDSYFWVNQTDGVLDASLYATDEVSQRDARLKTHSFVRNVAGLPVTAPSFVATAKVQVQFGSAGVGLFVSEENALGISVREGGVIQVWRRELDSEVVLAEVETPDQTQELRIECLKQECRLFYLKASGGWNQVGPALAPSRLPAPPEAPHIVIVGGHSALFHSLAVEAR